MYLLYPFLVTWLMPPGCNILIALTGAILSVRYQRAGQGIIIAGFLLLWAMSTPILAYAVLDTLQKQYPALPLNDLPSEKNHSVIVVLGAGNDKEVENGNKIGPSSTELTRLHYAALLHKKTGFPIIVSGGRGRGESITEAEIMQETLSDTYHIQNVIPETMGLNTREESVFVAKLVQQYHFDTVYLVTNAWHMPRSVSLFSREGMKVVPAPMGYETYDTHYSVLSFIPNIHALLAMSLAMHEYIGLAWYHFTDNPQKI